MEVFKYLGCVPSQDDGNAHTVRFQIVKARWCWAQNRKVLRSKNASPRVCGYFYKAVVQAVMLFGSESWNLTPALLTRLEGFRI